MVQRIDKIVEELQEIQKNFRSPCDEFDNFSQQGRLKQMEKKVGQLADQLGNVLVRQEKQLKEKEKTIKKMRKASNRQQEEIKKFENLQRESDRFSSSFLNVDNSKQYKSRQVSKYEYKYNNALGEINSLKSYAEQLQEKNRKLHQEKNSYLDEIYQQKILISSLQNQTSENQEQMREQSEEEAEKIDFLQTDDENQSEESYDEEQMVAQNNYQTPLVRGGISSWWLGLTQYVNKLFS